MMMDWNTVIVLMIAMGIFWIGWLLGMMRREKREADEQAAHYERQLAARHAAPKHAYTRPRNATSEFSSLFDD